MTENRKQLSGFTKFDYFLLAFGVLIAGPRFSGAFAAAIGVDLIAISPIWAWIEIFSGWALAMFEAFALARIASRFRGIRLLNEDESLPLKQRIVPTNAIYWVILLVGQIVLLLSIPMITTVHLATLTFREAGGPAMRVPEILTWTNIGQNHLTWLWLFLSASASTLFVFMLGLVIHDLGGVVQREEVSATERAIKAYTVLRKKMPTVDPISLSQEAGITVREAANFLDTYVQLEVVNTNNGINAESRLKRLQNLTELEKRKD